MLREGIFNATIKDHMSFVVKITFRYENTAKCMENAITKTELLLAASRAFLSIWQLVLLTSQVLAMVAQKAGFFFEFA